MTTPLTREAMEALLDDTMLKSDTASLRILTLATAILAAWDERDAVDRSLRIERAVSTDLGRRVNAAEAKLADTTAERDAFKAAFDKLQILIAQATNGWTADIAERDAANARLREACCDAIQWASHYRWAAPWCDVMRSAIKYYTRASLNKEPTPTDGGTGAK